MHLLEISVTCMEEVDNTEQIGKIRQRQGISLTEIIERGQIMREEHCIFCRIANGEIPSSTIYEDEDFRVFLDLNPATRGHALLVPKEHYGNLFELEDGLCEKAIVLAKRIAGRMKKALGCEGMNLIQNNGEAAGQTVFHFHLHLIPRYQGDTAGITWTPGKASEKELEELVALLSEE